tara:strand:+ start:2438 stop:2743 length:306 start_codon:yes stop_codon:yes gene_type:complete
MKLSEVLAKFEPGWADIKLEAADVKWTKDTLTACKIGGVWMVPRSGVSVVRVGEFKLRFEPPLAHEEYDPAAQEGEMVAIYAHARAAGFEFEDEIGYQDAD